MIKVYCVQPFFGNHEKYFRDLDNAKKYRTKLAEKMEIDIDCIELMQVYVTPKEYNAKDCLICDL